MRLIRSYNDHLNMHVFVDGACYQRLEVFGAPELRVINSTQQMAARSARFRPQEGRGTHVKPSLCDNAARHELVGAASYAAPRNVSCLPDSRVRDALSPPPHVRCRGVHQIQRSQENDAMKLCRRHGPPKLSPAMMLFARHDGTRTRALTCHHQSLSPPSGPSKHGASRKRAHRGAVNLLTKEKRPVTYPEESKSALADAGTPTTEGSGQPQAFGKCTATRGN